MRVEVLWFLLATPRGLLILVALAAGIVALVCLARRKG